MKELYRADIALGKSILSYARADDAKSVSWRRSSAFAALPAASRGSREPDLGRRSTMHTAISRWLAQHDARRPTRAVTIPLG
jgi:hypothetical protein